MSVGSCSWSTCNASLGLDHVGPGGHVLSQNPHGTLSHSREDEQPQPSKVLEHLGPNPQKPRAKLKARSVRRTHTHTNRTTQIFPTSSCDFARLAGCTALSRSPIHTTRCALTLRRTTLTSAPGPGPRHEHPPSRNPW
eukprot:5007594-Prymnesium_polylepis.1